MGRPKIEKPSISAERMKKWREKVEGKRRKPIRREWQKEISEEVKNRKHD